MAQRQDRHKEGRSWNIITHFVFDSFKSISEDVIFGFEAFSIYLFSLGFCSILFLIVISIDTPLQDF